MNSDNQEIIYHINCFEYIYIYIYIYIKTMEFSWFHSSYSMVFTFNSIHWVSYIYRSIILLYTHYDLLLQEHFYSQLLFYVHFCVLRINTFLGSVQQTLQLQSQQFHLSFFNGDMTMISYFNIIVNIIIVTDPTFSRVISLF